MSTTAVGATQANEVLALKKRLKATWMTGNYDLFARFMEKDSEPFFRRLGRREGAIDVQINP